MGGSARVRRRVDQHVADVLGLAQRGLRDEGGSAGGKRGFAEFGLNTHRDDPDLRPDGWTIRTVLDRLEARGDPFRALLGVAQRLPAL